MAANYTTSMLKGKNGVFWQMQQSPWAQAQQHWQLKALWKCTKADVPKALRD